MAGETTPPLAYLDASREAHFAITLFENQANLGELIEQFGPRQVTGHELDRYRHVCRKNYDSLRIREIEAPTSSELGSEEDESEEVVPYFEVSCDGISYDSTSMGFGELCACYVIWWVYRFTSSTILVLDEPDSHLSPSSRNELLDIIALAASDKKHAVILSTHSAELLDRLVESEILVVLPDRLARSRSNVSRATSKRHALRGLGLSRPARILVVVEDVDAKEAARQILNLWGDGLARYFDIQIVEGGATELARFVRQFPKSSGSFRAYGLLDGDKRTEFKTAEDLIFLPEDNDPIAAARAKIQRDVGAFSQAIGVEEKQVVAALDRVSHLDHHDFINGLIDALGMHASAATVRTAVIAAWLNDDAVRRATREAAETLLGHLAAMPLN
ncbi:AAA family ATPase [Arenimonas malthae]|uniref:AAA family ATPase n=1 Tax=Arenimonas malthae TaxID=354197 RepID=UPI0014701E0C|nr:AAA family ATPase [Arenimonas malthae]